MRNAKDRRTQVTTAFYIESACYISVSSELLTLIMRNSSVMKLWLIAFSSVFTQSVIVAWACDWLMVDCRSDKPGLWASPASPRKHMTSWYAVFYLHIPSSTETRNIYNTIITDSRPWQILDKPCISISNLTRIRTWAIHNKWEMWEHAVISSSRIFYCKIYTWVTHTQGVISLHFFAENGYHSWSKG